MLKYLKSKNKKLFFHRNYHLNRKKTAKSKITSKKFQKIDQLSVQIKKINNLSNFKELNLRKIHFKIKITKESQI